jgi:hypothetical protein
MDLCSEKDMDARSWRLRPSKEEMKKRNRGGGAGSGCFQASGGASQIEAGICRLYVYGVYGDATKAGGPIRSCFESDT